MPFLANYCRAGSKAFIQKYNKVVYLPKNMSNMSNQSDDILQGKRSVSATHNF